MHKYFITTFGCAQNEADSQRLASQLENRGMVRAQNLDNADHVIINTCMIREMAENRVYGAVNNLGKKRVRTGRPVKIILTGCMVGMAVRDNSGKFLKLLKRRLPDVDEFLPIEEVGFDFAPLRTDPVHAWVPISNGCNNFCTFCVVPFTRGREISRPYEEVLSECKSLAQKGYTKITLLGMNVNSYGADLLVGKDNIQVLRDTDRKYFENNLTMEPALLPTKIRTKAGRQYNNGVVKGYVLPDGRIVKPILVKHLNRLRIPTLFPHLLSDITKIEGIESIEFMSSNPWDFSEELIDVVARYPNISKTLHIAVQSGSDSVLKKMNRWYTRADFLRLVEKLRNKIKNLKLSTDIIVGFCGETEADFQDTVDLVEKSGFYKAYISIYSDRPMTAAHKAFKDDVSHQVKKERWLILENLINRNKL